MLTPPFLRMMLEDQYGALSEKIINGYSANRHTTLRVNTLKTTVFAVKEYLHKQSIRFTEVDWYQDALILEKARENELRKTDLYEKGEIYLQSLSSMLPPIELDAHAGESVLDMTAAPGGKTTQISALSNGKALVTACERDKVRFERLKYNVEKQGAQRITLLQTDALKLDDFFRFDKILLDAPCSGSGILDLQSYHKISEKLVRNCALLQEKLLLKALKLLKKGGTMVYSTCSVLKKENEDILDRVLSKTDAEIVPIQPFFSSDLLPSKCGTICICPDEFFEGFFLVKIRKP